MLLEWMRFLDEHDVQLFDSRARLKGALADTPSIGRPPARTAVRCYDLGPAHECVVGFYRWAIAETMPRHSLSPTARRGYCSPEPAVR